MCCFQCSLCGYLPLQATPLAPVGILAHLPMPAGRWGTLKCAVRCASPARWGTLCMVRQRGSAFPTVPGRANSHSANVRAKLKTVFCMETAEESCRQVTHMHAFKLLHMHWDKCLLSKQTTFYQYSQEIYTIMPVELKIMRHLCFNSCHLKLVVFLFLVLFIYLFFLLSYLFLFLPKI